MNIKYIAFVLLTVLFLQYSVTCAFAEYQGDENIPSEFLCDFATGTVIYEKNADERRPLASVTKIMTMLLVLESVDRAEISLDDSVSVSAYSSGMGGSQVYLKEGECFSVGELLKCVAVVSANDACVALAEYVCGSEEAFVQRMNERASELGMENTHFENTNGLDDTATEHYSSARDIAKMSRELMKHPQIFEYTTIWTDTFRDGTFGLTNTNKLIRFYKGANGLKTGSTSKAMYCISATAMRDGTQLISVIMGAPTSDIRNAAAKRMLDYGFANYETARFSGDTLEEFPVIKGSCEFCTLEYPSFNYLCSKGQREKIRSEIELPDFITAPMKKGSTVGKITYYIDNEEIGQSNITLTEDVPIITYSKLLKKFVSKFLAV